MTQDSHNKNDRERLPSAKIKKNRITWLFWLVPLAALAFTGWIVYSRTIGGGPIIHIHFKDAADLEPGKSMVKFRGAIVGEVKAIHIANDYDSVDVEVQIHKGADRVAQEGSEFWIVKPQVSAAQIKGLRTIVSGSYIGVKPGTGAAKNTFEGVNEPSLIERRRPGLQFVLLSTDSLGIGQGTPVLYRGIKIGEVTDAGLGTNSQTVHFTVDINKNFAPLVRENSRFWNVGGVNVNFGIHGLDVSAESFKTLIGGGIALATPDAIGKEAPEGTAFRLYQKPEDAWTRWMPEIPLPSSEPALAAIHGDDEP